MEKDFKENLPFKNMLNLLLFMQNHVLILTSADVPTDEKHVKGVWNMLLNMPEWYSS